MRTAALSALLLLSAMLFVRPSLAASPAQGYFHDAPPPPFAPDRVLVSFKPGTAAAEIGKAHREARGHALTVIPAIGVQVVGVPAGTVLERIARYRASPNVAYAEPDYYRVLIVPNEEDYSPLYGGPVRDYFAEQWGLNNTGQALTDPNGILSYGPLYG